MSSPAATETSAAVADPASLGRELARRDATVDWTAARGGVRREVRRLRRRLRAVADRLEREPGGAAGARDRQWILDNGHVIEVALSQVVNDLPPAFYRRLPAARGARRPRIAALARRAVEAIDDPRSLGGMLRTFLSGYQEVAPLSMAELWAFPTLVRLALLAVVTRVGERLAEGRSPAKGDAGEPARLDAAQCVMALRSLAAIDWRDLFEATSGVDHRLRDDPSGTYTEMDFASRDRYRKAVEALAGRDAEREAAVAEAALRLAARGAVGARERHVGYYLIDRGRATLEREIGFRPHGLRERLRRGALAHPAPVFLGGVGGMVAGLYALLLAAGVASGVRGWIWSVPLLAGLPLALTVAETALRGALGDLIDPQPLPKLDRRGGIPPRERTLVVFPVLIGDREEVDHLLRGMEINALANPDRELAFALLTDWVDAEAPMLPGDEELLARAIAGVEQLNAAGGELGARFHLLHRQRRFNPAEDCWMGWERKRGKLEELNRLLLGEGDGFSTRVGDAAFLREVRFVITLDADTVLPRGAARRLVGTLAHPLNAPELDDDGRVVRGHGVLQPRTEVAPESARRSLFARLLAGSLGPDLYHAAISDLYQDLFGEGLYAGKGIYDVRAFAASLEGRVPENRVLSHDLFEGLHSRTGYASDVSVYEEAPSHVLGELARGHRWARGDWQLLPWLGRRVPARGGGTLPSRFGAMGRWKLADNLRRSLVAPAALALLVAGLGALGGDPWVWAAVALGPLFAPMLLDGLRFLGKVLGVRRGWTFAVVESARLMARGAVRAAVETMLLPVRAQQMLDAVGRTLYRLGFSRRRLLEWRTAARTARRLGTEPTLGRHVAGLWPAPAAAVVLLALGPSLAVAGRALATGLALLWIAAPAAAWHLGRIGDRDRWSSETVSEADRLRLRRLARRTWNFFERYVGPEDHWLPPDNFQEVPRGMVARRTSPTNIGLYLTSILAAYDLGYLDARRLVARLRNTLDTLSRLERHRGHFWNWTNSETLAPLEPRYVSTVDSGNLAVALVAVARGCEEIVRAPRVRRERAAGIADAIALLRETVEPAGSRASSALRRRVVRDLESLEVELRRAPEGESEWIDRLRAAHERSLPELEGDVRRWIDEEASSVAAGGELSEVAIWLERVEHEIAAEIDDLTRFAEVGSEGLALADELRELAARADRLALEMDFAFLYDRERQLFRIGFDLHRGELDPNHYDLLASEVRLTSLWAIAKGDVPVEHWLHLGRPYGRIAGERALLSWGGTAFEYLMPELYLRAPVRTPLARSSEAATRRQIAWAHRHGAPWGVSESAFHSYGAHEWYQYRAFGVPGTGLRRGLGERLVVSPYSSLLALRVAPRAVIRNLDRLDAAGAAARFGYYEALDYGPSRRRVRSRPEVVRSFMSHHQGMILGALANFLAGSSLVRRVHADPRVASAAILLHEEVRFAPLADVRLGVERLPELPSVRVPAWRALPVEARADLQVLSNGRLSVVVTAAGGGGSRWRGMALTPWHSDPSIDRHGTWIYLRDLDSGALWSAGRAPTGVLGDLYEVEFAPHRVEIHRRDHGIRVRTVIAVAPGIDVAVRWLTIGNESERRRRLSIVAFAEVAMASIEESGRHPAFARLFVESEYLPEQGALLFRRRPRWAEEPRLFFAFALVPDRAVRWESCREEILGRGGAATRPAWLTATPREGRTGATLDPAAALEGRLELAAGESRRLAFVSAAGESRDAVLEALERARDLSHIESLLAEGDARAEDEMLDLELASDDLRGAQRLLAAVLGPDPALRTAGPWLPGADWLGQRGLWGHGISGDLPILLVELGEEPNRALVRSLLAIHARWRSCCAEVDLVLLDLASEGYAWPLRDWLDRELARTGAIDWLHRPAGVFVLRAKHLPAADRELLRRAARVLIDGAAPSLESVLAPLAELPERLPEFVPVPSSPPAGEPTPPLARPLDLALDNGFGGFSADGREYVVHLEPGESTPAPWVNVVANEEAGFLVSETGAGCTWVGNSGENRLTPWFNDPLLDPVGEALYLRDEETGTVWSPTPAPAGGDGTYQVRHAAGETRFLHHRHGLLHELALFVPAAAPLKIARLRLENVWRRPRRITATYFAEWVLGGRRSVTAPRLVTDFLGSCGALLAQNPFHLERSTQVAFLAADRPVHGFTADRHEFLVGGDAAHPPGLARIGLGETVGYGIDPCGALQIHLDLAAGGVAEMAFLLGAAEDRATAERWVLGFREPGRIERERTAMLAGWDRLLGALQIETPLAELDLLANRWLLYQTVACRLWGRSGLYQSSGAFGFRDQLQDVGALHLAAPELARAHLVRAAARQFADGDVLHWWHPEGNRGVRTRCSDDLLWLPFSVAEYVRATDDRTVLDERAPFLSGRPLVRGETDRYDDYRRAAEEAPVYEHCRRAIERGATASERGLPRIGSCDWNDGFDRVGAGGRGESIWLAWFLAVVLERFAPLAEGRGERAEATELRELAGRYRRAAEAAAWDGAWYRRATFDDGSPLGSAANREGRIDLLAQAWAAWAGASPERVEEALQSAFERLDDREQELLRLLAPPYDRSRPSPGYIAGYPPGVRENGGQYNHAAVWAAWAATLIGDGERAFQIVRGVLPTARAATREAARRYRLEPYVLAGDVYAEPPHVGRGGWSWYSGSAAWLHRFVVEAMLGLVVEGERLTVAPCLPPSWPGYHARLRRGESTLYRIEVDNREGTGGGVGELRLDGVRQAGTSLPLIDDGARHDVSVVLA